MLPLHLRPLSLTLSIGGYLFGKRTTRKKTAFLPHFPVSFYEQLPSGSPSEKKAKITLNSFTADCASTKIAHHRARLGLAADTGLPCVIFICLSIGEPVHLTGSAIRSRPALVSGHLNQMSIARRRTERNVVVNTSRN